MIISFNRGAQINSRFNLNTILIKIIMNRKLVANKGYTVKVVSWENDGDNYKTNSLNVDSPEEARKIKKICKELFKSCHNGDGGVGNSMDGECDDVIDQYIEDNIEMGLIKDHIKILAGNLLGYSETYDYRVCESVEITYLDEDVYAEIID